MRVTFDWYAGLDLVEREFIETGKGGNRRRSVIFDGEDLTPTERAELVAVVGIETDGAENVYFPRQDILRRAVPLPEPTRFGWVGHENHSLDKEPTLGECIALLLNMRAAEAAARAYEREKQAEAKANAEAEAIARMRAEADSNIIVGEESDDEPE